MNNSEAKDYLQRLSDYEPSKVVLGDAVCTAIAALNEADRVCEWRDDFSYWQSDCDNQFVFIDGGPVENEMEYMVEFKCGAKWIRTERMESRVKAESVKALFHRNDVVARVVVVKTEEYLG